LTSTSIQPSGKQLERKKRNIITKKRSRKRKARSTDEDWVASQEVISKRSSSRRKRSNASQRAICAKIDSAEAHDLHQFQCWNSNFGIDQPFQVAVSPLAVAMADFHSHMSTNEEVIGLLVGSWDKEARTVRVSCAKPCAHLDNGEDTSINVEMDPVSEMEVRAWIETEEASKFCGVPKPIVVGWYHSHPVFEPIPSTKDIENNLRYQQLLENPDLTCDNVPFLGLIVGPWDIRMLDKKSVQHWFVVKKVVGISNSERGLPMKIHVKSDTEGVTNSQVPHLKLEMSTLANKYKGSVNFDTLWRNFVYVKGEDGKIKMVDGSVSRLEKLNGSLKADLQDLDDKLSETLVSNALLSVSDKLS